MNDECEEKLEGKGYIYNGTNAAFCLSPYPLVRVCDLVVLPLYSPLRYLNQNEGLFTFLSPQVYFKTLQLSKTTSSTSNRGEEWSDRKMELIVSSLMSSN